MKIIKPMSLGLLYKTYQQARRHHLVVTALGFFALGGAASGRLLSEPAQWKKVMRVLPTGQALDEASPKAQAEVLVLGRACAPGGVPVTHMPVRLQVGAIDKHLTVYGARRWRYGVLPLLGITPPEPFVAVPLDYAHAFGGMSYADNPQGQGHNPNRLAALVGTNEGVMPQLEYAAEPVNCHTHAYAPAALGPMAIDWLPRKRHAGTYDARWLKEDYPGLPRDLDWRLYNQAASDQRLPASFQGGEPYLLQGMHPALPELRGTLPDQRVRAFACPKGATATALREIAMQMDTVWFLPEQEIGVVAWRGQIEVADSDALDIASLMLAYEGAQQAPRTLDYYAQAFALRSNPKTAGLHAFNESQLTSELSVQVTQAAQAQEQADAAIALAKKQARLDELHAEFLERSGLQGLVEVAPIQATPPLLQTPAPRAMAQGDMDLSAMMNSVQALLDRVQADAQTKQLELKKQLTELDDMLPGASTPPATAQADRQAVFERACGTADEATLAALELAQASAPLSPASSAAGNPAAAISPNAAVSSALRLKAQARLASPTPLAPAQTLPPDLALELGAQVQTWVAQGVALRGRDLAGADLRGAQLAGLDLSECLLELANLSGANLRGCNLRRAVLTQARLDGAQLDGAQLDQANLCGSHALGASLRNASMKALRASGAHWAQVDASGAQLASAQLDQADLSGAVFDGAKLDNTLLNQAQLAGSRWQGAHFSKCVGWKLQASGADFSGSVWTRSALIGADLRASLWCGARLTQVQGNDADWRAANLSGLRAQRSSWTNSQLQEANLSQALLDACDLSRANLSAVDLRGACLPKTLLLQAQLNGVNAMDADFFQALLRKADLSAADLRNASLYQAELTEVVWTGSNTTGVRLDARRELTP